MQLMDDADSSCHAQKVRELFTIADFDNLLQNNFDYQTLVGKLPRIEFLVQEEKPTYPDVFLLADILERQQTTLANGEFMRSGTFGSEQEVVDYVKKKIVNF